MMGNINLNQRERILEVSRELFIQFGYKGVSMRMIAEKLGMTHGNIYNYFQNKDMVYAEIMKPLLKELDEYLHRFNDEIRIDDKIFHDLNLYMLKEMLHLAETYPAELNLLIYKSQGSQYENFGERYISRGEKVGNMFLEAMKAKYPSLNTDFTPLFNRFNASRWYTLLCDLAMHPDIPIEERRRFIKEYMIYSSGGWESLMKSSL